MTKVNGMHEPENISARNNGFSTKSILTVLFMLVTLQVMAQVRIIDAADSVPVVGAIVTSQNGNYLGMTGENGVLPKKAMRERRLNIRHVAYETLDVTLGKDSLLAMSALPQTIDEVLVLGPQMTHHYTRSYFRIYQLRDSVLQYARVGYLDTFYKLSDKSYKYHVVMERFLVSPDAERKKNGALHSDFFLGIIKVTSGGLPSPDGIRSRADSVSSDAFYVHNKQGDILQYVRLNRKQGTAYVFQDVLAESDGDAFSPLMLKLLGFKDCRITESTRNQTYTITDDDTERMTGSYLTMSIEAQFRRDSVGHDYQIFGEIYPASVRYITREQSKDLWKHPPVDDAIMPPEGKAALPDYLQEAMSKMEVERAPW